MKSNIERYSINFDPEVETNIRAEFNTDQPIKALLQGYCLDIESTKELEYHTLEDLKKEDLFTRSSMNQANKPIWELIFLTPEVLEKLGLENDFIKDEA